MSKLKKISLISAFHFYKLFFRTALFITVLVFYIIGRVENSGEIIGGIEKYNWILGFVWIVFFVEMVFRFFPSRFESMGCQKQFRKNYKPTSNAVPAKGSSKSTFLVLLSWILLNTVIAILYFSGFIDKGILILISLFYSVADMICILFFCPFQTWFMKNKCCGSCRIYNWDYAMMFTPLALIKNPFTWSIFGVSLFLAFVWELSLRIHPERFSEQTNKSLSCAECPEKLCQHKSQLRSFLRKNSEIFMVKSTTIIKKTKEKLRSKNKPSDSDED